MSIRVEFYGVARIRSGVESIAIDLENGGSLPLGDALRLIVGRCPQLADSCIEGERLNAAFVANVDGDSFVDRPDTLLHDGQCLLILSADAGG